MNTDRHGCRLLRRCGACAAVAILTCLVAEAESPIEQSQAKAITVEQLSKSAVIGYLGHPLGDLLTIEGRYERERPKYESKLPNTWTKLLIYKVNGVKLPRAVVYDFPSGPMFDAIDPVDGQEFKLAVYETGRFWGRSKDAGKYEAHFVARTGDEVAEIHFMVRLVVLNDFIKGISESEALR